MEECRIFNCEVRTDKRLQSAPEYVAEKIHRTYVAAKSPPHTNHSDIIHGSKRAHAPINPINSWLQESPCTPLTRMNFVAPKEPMHTNQSDEFCGSKSPCTSDSNHKKHVTSLSQSETRAVSWPRTLIQSLLTNQNLK